MNEDEKDKEFVREIIAKQQWYEAYRKMKKENELLKEENDKLKYNQLEADELIKALEEKNKEQEKELLHWKGQYHLLSRKLGYISKDKIRDKIKELEEDLIENYGELGESLTTNEIKTLKKLLEEE